MDFLQRTIFSNALSKTASQDATNKHLLRILSEKAKPIKE